MALVAPAYPISVLRSPLTVIFHSVSIATALAWLLFCLPLIHLSTVARVAFFAPCLVFLILTSTAKFRLGSDWVFCLSVLSLSCLSRLSRLSGCLTQALHGCHGVIPIALSQLLSAPTSHLPAQQPTLECESFPLFLSKTSLNVPFVPLCLPKTASFKAKPPKLPKRRPT